MQISRRLPGSRPAERGSTVSNRQAPFSGDDSRRAQFHPSTPATVFFSGDLATEARFFGSPHGSGWSKLIALPVLSGIAHDDRQAAWLWPSTDGPRMEEIGHEPAGPTGASVAATGLLLRGFEAIDIRARVR